MKALLKRITGGLKMTAAFLPIAAMLGGTATFIWLACSSASTYHGALDEVRSLPSFQETVEKDTEILKDQLDCKKITTQDYIDKLDAMKSDEFVVSFLRLDEQGNKAFIDKIRISDIKETIGIICAATFPVAAGGGLLLYFVFDGFWYIFESARDDFQKAKEIKEEKRKKREMEEYKEEVQ